MSKKAAARPPRRPRLEGGRRGGLGGPLGERDRRGGGKGLETIEAAPEAGRSFSRVCACGYFYTPPTFRRRLGVLKGFLRVSFVPCAVTPAARPRRRRVGAGTGLRRFQPKGCTRGHDACGHDHSHAREPREKPFSRPFFPLPRSLESVRDSSRFFFFLFFFLEIRDHRLPSIDGG